ncbi:gamma-glutamyltransferase family protein [Egibacter rhizosphaerae]|uniref:Gamma-glutamyltransferase family protein n=1 Tax=Egibacter rhizosphaerae TaxID=1670831 RepID=A0A411YH97_9ACTN|nr:gamma-glutamyltransferase family protein [Egibacter rhizosphaerae]QBI20491.1 gamma-glutamyltransferase family protein [Egibacter rhizosphaerae]
MITTRPELQGTHGMVSSTHWLASGVGMAALEAGGNAFDAAVAAGLTLQVVEPHLNGPAGEVPIMVYDAAIDAVEVVAGQGVAPAAASVEHFHDLGLDRVPGTGPLAACVPGAFDAWMRLALERGRLPLRDLMSPAIEYATRGFPILPRINAVLEAVAPKFREDWPESAALWLADGVPRAGDWFANTDLAATYTRILEEAEAAGSGREAQIQAARDAFYRGFVAERIVEFHRSTPRVDTSGAAHTGLLTEQDLAAYEAPVETPLSVDYHGWTVYKPHAWSQAPVFLQQLRLLEGFDLDPTAPDDPGFVHLVVEAAKLAFADREAWYGDPAFVDVPTDDLLDPAYADQRRRLIGDDASLELRPGAPGGREPVLPPELPPTQGTGNALGIGEPTVDSEGESPGDTCHVDVVDAEGNMVSATPSGGWLQSSPVVPGLGFALGTRAQMFWLDPQHPNALEGGKRPRTTLTAGIARRDGRARLAFGTPGGDRQDQWGLVFFLRHLHHGMNLQEAIDAPTFHSDHFPSSFFPRDASPGALSLEDRFPKETVAELERRGHLVTREDPWSLGRLSAVSAAGDPAPLKAGANPRGQQGYAAGR